jgi:hypothetical protein
LPQYNVKGQEPSFATVTGLALWDTSAYSEGGIAGNLSGKLSGLMENQNMVKLRKLFKSFLP